jgi:hypothetical protein
MDGSPKPVRVLCCSIVFFGWLWTAQGAPCTPWTDQQRRTGAQQQQPGKPIPRVTPEVYFTAEMLSPGTRGRTGRP